MSLIKFFLGFLIYGKIAIASAYSASLLIDSFDYENLELSSEITPGGSFAKVPGTFLDERSISGPRLDQWSASLKQSEGTLTLSTLSPPSEMSFFLCSYSREGDLFGILGYEGFSIQISNLTGLGEIAIVGQGDYLTAPRVPITEAGSLFYPLSNLNQEADLSSMNRLIFAIFPRSSDFSVTLDEISLVPEPCVAGLALTAGFMLLPARRRRPVVPDMPVII